MSRTRALVIGPYLHDITARAPLQPGRTSAQNLIYGQEGPHRTMLARLEEAKGLTAAIDLNICDTLIVSLHQLKPATYIGTGKVEEIATIVRAEEIALVMMDCALSPIQQRNLEKAWNTKVIDRTGLILEIFGQRARTKEGRMQVELAHLAYQKSRLVRSWTHLERQRGGFGFMGGPGETQIETDRRLIQERMTRLSRDLEQVKRTRRLHREKRQEVPFPVVALVGYTNAGKSTLFNQLTHAHVDARDMLFATLDPTLRAIMLPSRIKMMLSDTVGFISDLPTQLISAFRATLEEVTDATLIIHVHDISHTDWESQGHDVEKILMDLGLNPHETDKFITVWNKMDLLDPDHRMALERRAAQMPPTQQPILISAQTGEGLEKLIHDIDLRLTHTHVNVFVDLNPGEGQALAWLHETGQMLDKQASKDGHLRVKVKLSPSSLASFSKIFPQIRLQQIE